MKSFSFSINPIKSCLVKLEKLLKVNGFKKNYSLVQEHYLNIFMEVKWECKVNLSCLNISIKYLKLLEILIILPAGNEYRKLNIVSSYLINSLLMGYLFNKY
jgi:hypothetical protein